MFSQILQNETPANAWIAISGQISLSQNQLGGNNPIFREALYAVDNPIRGHQRLRKTDVLELWGNDNLSFAAKCLITLWWGHPNHLTAARAYSEANFAKLASAELEEAFTGLTAETDLTNFKTGLDLLSVKFSRGGEYHLDCIDISFYSKFFHFWFASHPPVSCPQYLPVIADDIIRKAVYAEMMDRGEDVNLVFYQRNASIKSYVAFADKFNEYAGYCHIEPFLLEDKLFGSARGLGDIYVSAYNRRLCLPDWIAGRYNEQVSTAIVFNNLKGETYLFEGPTARLWSELLEYGYGESFNIDGICDHLQCSRFDLLSFMKELRDKKIIIDHKFGKKELAGIRKAVNREKKQFLRSNKGVGNFHSSYESVDNDYRNRISELGIPFTMSFELTYACNEACIHCYNPNSPRQGGMETQKAKPVGEMSAEEYFPVLDKMKEMGVAKIVFTGGDPFMKKDAMKIIEYAHRLKFAFAIYTNGQALFANPMIYEKLKELYPQYIGLSIYSTIPEVHDGITRRRGSCEKTMEIARRCYEDAIGLQIKCPIMQSNAESYGKVYDFAISVNGMPQFDVNITSSLDGDCFASQNLRMTEEQFMKVLRDKRIPLSIENTVGAIDRRPEMCFCGAGDSGFNIRPDGTLTPCCAFPLDCGNVKETALEELWKNSAELERIRALRYRDSDLCGRERFCKYCNRCIGQSFIEHGVAENHSEDNCHIAKIRLKLAEEQ